MKNKKRKIVGENDRTVLQPVLFGDENEKERGILSPEIDTMDELVSYKSLRKRRIKLAITRAVIWTLIVALLPIIVFCIVMVFSSNSGNNFFGYSYYIVETGSMRPEFSEGDLIIVKTNFTIDEIQSGVDISFVREIDGKVVTHRVKSFEDTENGREYITYGINVPQGNDLDTVNYNNIIGLRIATSESLGEVIMFLRSPSGMVVMFSVFALMFAGVFVSFRLSNDIRAVGK